MTNQYSCDENGIMTYTMIASCSLFLAIFSYLIPAMTEAFFGYDYSKW